MVITLTLSRFIELKKIMDVISAALNHNNTSGEISNAVNSAEWDTSVDEIKITLV